MRIELGSELETEKRIKIDDLACQSGLYILGKPGMGKSNLMELMILAAIQKENGVFFLDPHGDAIEKIVSYLPTDKDTLIRILDPEDEEYSFGINPLSCRDLSSLKERTKSYIRAFNIFYKIWEEDWGIWLQLILQNTLYVFLENTEYTLAEVPWFYTDENFRHHLVSNVNYNLDVKDFWQTRFESKREYDQQRQVDAALTRISTLLGQPYSRHIIGQKKTTLDFSKGLAKGEVIFLKLSASLPADIKKFIGTMVISELLHAVRHRPPETRSLFNVCIDEFQNFANSDNVADRFNVNENYIDMKRIILKKTRELYCTRRDRIEAEINERQAQWNKSLSSQPAKNATDKKGTDRPDKPPLTRSPM